MYSRKKITESHEKSEKISIPYGGKRSLISNRVQQQHISDVSSIGFNFEYYVGLEYDHKKKFLKKTDVLVLYNALKALSSELGIVKVENYILTDFLQKNEPKLLEGLELRRKTARKASLRANATPIARMQSISGMSMRSMTNTIIGNPIRNRPTYTLTLSTKIEMAEKICVETYRRVHDIKIKGMQKIKDISSYIEELQYRSAETKALTENFKLHFLHSAKDAYFLETASEKQIATKFSNFLANWRKQASALLSSIRIKMIEIEHNYKEKRDNLTSKLDLSDILGAVDFEKLMIKRLILKNKLNTATTDLIGLKGIMGRVSHDVAKAKQTLLDMEKNYQLTRIKIIEVIKALNRLDQDTQNINSEREKLLKKLRYLKNLLEQKEAPSVADYICQKEKLEIMEKEDKILSRKIYILTMTLKNLRKRMR